MIGEKGVSYQFHDVDNSYIVFMISGCLRVTDCRGNVIELKADNMYAFSIIAAPYHTEALEDYHAIFLLSSSLRDYVKAENVKKILLSKNNLYGVSELPLNDVMKFFVENLLLLRDVNDANIYTIKKIEFLHYLRRLYSFDEISAFSYGILSTYSKFKMDVFRFYTNSTNVQEMADRMLMTNKTFTRRFKEEFNRTPHEWLVNQKIFHLTKLINEKEYTVSQILEEFDFSSYSSFKQFCKRYNVEHLSDKF